MSSKRTINLLLIIIYWWAQRKMSSFHLGKFKRLQGQLQFKQTGSGPLEFEDTYDTSPKKATHCVCLGFLEKWLHLCFNVSLSQPLIYHTGNLQRKDAKPQQVLDVPSVQRVLYTHQSGQPQPEFDPVHFTCPQLS